MLNVKNMHAHLCSSVCWLSSFRLYSITIAHSEWQVKAGFFVVENIKMFLLLMLILWVFFTLYHHLSVLIG